MRHDHLIIGAGPCGLAAAHELHRAGARPVVLERGAVAGGLASSFTDRAGFVWDQGAHVAFSYFGDFDTLLDDVMAGDVLRHQRSSYIRYGDSWVPYPFQHNLSALPTDDAVDCLVKMIDRPDGTVRNYEDWLLANFGTGIVERFMRPYHEKLWTVPTDEMSTDWVTHRVATVDWRGALRNLVERRTAPGWGPNSTFSYPGSGGIGEPFRRLAARLPDVRYEAPVRRIDPDARTVTYGSGEHLSYERLVSTMPLTALVSALTRCPAEVRAAAEALRHNRVLVVGVGARGQVDPAWHWLYFPESGYPFYRITNMGLFAGANMPEPRESHVSYLAEIALPADGGWPDDDAAVRRTVAGLERAGLLPDPGAVVSRYVRRIPMAYPIPTLDRTDAVALILDHLETRGIYSRGRFGVWLYEYGNMDHAMKMGSDVARHLLTGETERIPLPHRLPASARSVAAAVY
ncbi:FAD-dependent oxidoreductase [Micromonospora sp. NPDC004551]|uniref:protoporphyrinogen/coproporphyrinogen oxidase n=1 Tax=Micromonospora sp. NPDC004551 TaxID=3154284 RepID=UPI0033B6ED40